MALRILNEELVKPYIKINSTFEKLKSTPGAMSQ